MVSSSSPGSSDESRQEKSKKRKKKQESPNPERRFSRKEEVNKSRNYRGPRDNRDNREAYKPNRDFRRENNNTYGERSQRDRDREHRERSRDHYRKEAERPEDKRRHERSPLRRDEARPQHREYDDRNRRNREGNNEYNRKRNDFRQKKSSFEDMKMKKEMSPEWGKSSNSESKPKPQEKDKPNFEPSGKLTEDTNTVNGVIIKYAEPSDARKPKRRWRLYPFKGEKALPTLYIHRQSAYLMGRDRKIADIPLDHPSCSKQHAALQYRLISYQKEGGAEGRRIRPYLIDLESANGTFVNNVKLEPRRYHELLERDVIKFGFSSREYVLLHEHSKDDSFDDDVPLTTTA